jgi:hypothetical protein
VNQIFNSVRLNLLVAFFLATPALSESEVGSKGSLGSNCLVSQNNSYEIQEKKFCSFEFSMKNQTNNLREQYILSHNDPIEVFSYEMRLYWKKVDPITFFVRPPILGGLRDRFIDQVPLQSTLLFTTVVGGIGWEWDTGIYRLSSDMNVIHIRQRYSGNFLHSDVQRNPETNKIFFFDQGAADLRTEGSIGWFEWLTIGSQFRILVLQSRNGWLTDREWRFDSQLRVYNGDGTDFHLQGRHYFRKNNLRHDRLSTVYQQSSLGISIGF